MRVLFASSEVFPYIKTGGLADVAAGLPSALARTGAEVRVLMPAYGRVLQSLSAQLRTVATLPGLNARILELDTEQSQRKIWLLDMPVYYARGGNPYLDAEGNPWVDNAARFAAFCRAICELSVGVPGLDWAPDVVHLNDWQTGLAAALLTLHGRRPASVFTIHNLAYQGVFSQSEFAMLGLPAQLFHPQGLEFYGQFSFIKGGLVYADRISTVSPRYAQEIQTPEYGYGLEGLIRHRQATLSGILNGIDYTEWNPAADRHIAEPYDAERLEARRVNTAVLRKELRLPDDGSLLVGMVGRLVEQKGMDLVLAALPELMRRRLQLIVLGEGSRALELQLSSAARAYPEQLVVRIGYDERLAHRVEAGVDAFLMPSRFEPCGLNQLYSLRYGAIPVVRRVGGLADSVVHAGDAELTSGRATGVVFEHADPSAVIWAMDHTLYLHQERPRDWQAMQRRGMGIDWSWSRTAQDYLQLYRRAGAAG